MIYPSDFNYHPNQPNSKPTKNRFEVSIIHLETPENKLNDAIVEDESVWMRFFNNSSIHGFRYISDPKIHYRERWTWCILISLALFGTLYVSYLLQVRFSTSVLATVVESTFHPIYEVPFPAVTLCNNNRVNWNRVPAAIEFYLKNANDVTVSKFNEILIALNGFEFGSFEEFLKIKDIDISDLDHINLTELYQRVTYQCEELFIEPCWWRNKYMNCCDEDRGLFVMQKSEYGLCYAFNSAVNIYGDAREKSETNYPWRTSSFGDWSGLRVDVFVNDSTLLPVNKSRSSGVLVMVNHPFSWPNSAHFVPTGTTTAVTIKPSYSYTAFEVKRLSPTDRQCLYPDEAHQHKFHTLPGTLYFPSSCISECRQQEMIARCNCTIDFLFPSTGYAKCKISDLKCFLVYDLLFNYEKPPAGNPYFSDDEEGITCACLPECDSINYSFDISRTEGKIPDNEHMLRIDVHFQQSTMVKYRTDVVFDWLNLMVGFGGIAGLFLGCSLISVVEVLFYFTIGVSKIPWSRLYQIDWKL